MIMNPVKTFFLKYRQLIYSVLTAIVAITGLMNLYNVLEVNPISNDECLWINKKAGKDSIAVMIINVKEQGVTWNAGIRDGDQLLEINGVTIENAAVAAGILNQEEAGSYADYKVSRNGKIFETKVYIKKLINFSDLGFSLLALIWLLIGFVVIMANPEARVQKLFYATGVVFVLFMTVTFTRNKYVDIEGNLEFLIENIIWTISAVYLPFLIVHFFWIFPKPFKFAEKKWVRLVLLLMPLSIAMFVMVLGVVYLYYTFNPLFFFRTLFFLNFTLIGGFLTGLISLYINYKRLNTVREKRSVRVILFSYLLGVLSIIYFFYIASVLADNIFNSPEMFMPIILIVVLPISFGYSIFRYQLMDVSIVVKNTIVYGLATVFIGIIYFLSVYGLGQGLSSAIGTEYRTAIAAAAFVIFAMIFQSTKDKFQELLTKKFYPEQFTYQQVILKFSGDVVSIVGLENILDTMTNTFVSSLKVKQFGILLKDSSNLYHIRRKHNISADFQISENEKFIEYIRQQIYLSKPAAIDRQQFHNLFPDDHQKLIDAQIYTIVPLIIKGKIIGILLFGLKHAGSQFAGKDLELLYAAANQIAVAIENARLYESEVHRLTLERDLENARKIQENLLPKSVPELNGLDICGTMIPAMQVGGDYYDLIKVSDEKMFIIVGDVSGKGLSASLYMSKLQTMMRLYCTADRSPKEILIEVNRNIFTSMERNWFITVNLALVDTGTKKIKFCRAGHCPVLEFNNGTVNQYQSKGIGLGLEEGKLFAETLEEIELEYKRNSVYAFISDGVVEAMNEASQLYGMEMLEKVIKGQTSKSCREILECILLSIHDFKGRKEQNDDITVVLLKT